MQIKHASAIRIMYGVLRTSQIVLWQKKIGAFYSKGKSILTGLKGSECMLQLVQVYAGKDTKVYNL